MSRSLTFSGTGTLNTWQEPSALRQTVLNGLRANGWGVSEIQIDNALSTNQKLISIAAPLAAVVPTWNYNITVTYENTDDDGDVQSLLDNTINNLSPWFQDISLKLTHDSAHPFSAFLQNYGLYLALGFAGLVVVRSLVGSARTYAPVARGYGRRYGKYLLV